MAITLLLCNFGNVLHVPCLFFNNSNDYNLSLGSVFFRIHVETDKDVDRFQSNNNDFLNDLWLLFATLIFSLQV